VLIGPPRVGLSSLTRTVTAVICPGQAVDIPSFVLLNRPPFSTDACMRRSMPWEMTKIR
jgi:hypothetical protein